MLKMYQNWKSIFTLNLSHNKDKDFKLAQILESGDYGLIFDIRQTFKGRRTKAGIAFLVAEFEWFQECTHFNRKENIYSGTRKQNN